jgi:hypothetical protein
MPNDEAARRERRLFSSFGLRHYFVIRPPRRSPAKAGHLSFVIVP